MKETTTQDHINGNGLDKINGFKNENDEIEVELCKLRNLYMEMKKERVKTEKDTRLLENKLKLLQTEENKAYKKMNIEKKSKGDWEQARQKTIEFKAYLSDVKNQRKADEINLNSKIKEMRENINLRITDKKILKLQENRINNLQMKQKKLV